MQTWGKILVLAAFAALSFAAVGQTYPAKLRTPEVREFLGKQGFEVVASSAGEFAGWIRRE